MIAGITPNYINMKKIVLIRPLVISEYCSKKATWMLFSYNHTHNFKDVDVTAKFAFIILCCESYNSSLATTFVHHII